MGRHGRMTGRTRALSFRSKNSGVVLGQLHECNAIKSNDSCYPLLLRGAPLADTVGEVPTSAT